MIPAAELVKMIARHAKLVGDTSNMHLRAGKGYLVALSASKTGVVLRSRTKFDGELSACVDGSVLSGIIKGHGPVDLSVKDSRLNVKGGRLRADIPLVSAELPHIPKADEYAAMPAKDVTALKDALSRVSIREGGNDAQLSLSGDGKTLIVSYYDNYYGAFYDIPFRTKMSLGFMPADVPLVAAALGDGDVKIAQVGPQLLLASPGETFLVPSVAPEPVPTDKVDEDAKLVAKFDVAAFKLTLDSMSVLMKGKDANTLSVALGDNGITLSVSSEVGSMKKRIDADVKHKAQFMINHKFIHDIIALCAGEEARLLAYLGEDKSVSRIQVRCAGVHYVAVASV